MPAPTRRSIGSFEIERELGEGGMGVLYLARQPSLDRRVVLKTLRRSLADDATLEERFLREARAAASVHHQNVVAVYDCFSWRGERFIAQEYVPGENLSAVVAAVQRLTPRVAALVALELSRGLEGIHARGVVHRDLKPSNVLIGKAGEVKIADFGIALHVKASQLTQTGHTVGTPAYMSPEQHLGERADARSDLFSFGVVLYEMLTGELPFESDGEEEALVRRIESGRYAHPRRRAPGTPRWLERLVRRCLRARPKRRPAAAVAVREELERRLGSPSAAEAREEIAAWLWDRKVFRAEKGETAFTRRPLRASRRRALPLALAAALVAALAAALLIQQRAAPLGLPLPAFLAARESARVWFEAAPRTRVRVDERPPFLTPQHEPLALAPGLHRVVFTDPQGARAERTLEVAPGEERHVALE